jgi:hypothetical protein
MDLPKWRPDNFCPVLWRSAALELSPGPRERANPHNPARRPHDSARIGEKIIGAHSCAKMASATLPVFWLPLLVLRL